MKNLMQACVEYFADGHNLNINVESELDKTYGYLNRMSNLELLELIEQALENVDEDSDRR